MNKYWTKRFLHSIGFIPDTDKSTEAQQYDYEGYIKSLEKVLDGAVKDYWANYIDVSRHQLNVSRTYLWVSAALLGIYGAAYEKFHDNLLSSNSCLIALGCVSFILCCIGFGICLYAIPARNGYKTIFNMGWGEFSHQAYDLLAKKNENVYADFLTLFIAKVDNAIEHNFSTNLKRAKLLRFTSWILIISFSIAIIVALSVTTISTLTKSPHSLVPATSCKDGNSSIFCTCQFIAKQLTIYDPTKENAKMNEKSQKPQTQNTNSDTKQKPKVSVPPPTAQIIKNSSNTHALDSATSQTFITESKKGK